MGVPLIETIDNWGCPCPLKAHSSHRESHAIPLDFRAGVQGASGLNPWLSEAADMEFADTRTPFYCAT